MYRTSQVYSDNPNFRNVSTTHLIKELSTTLSEDPERKIFIGNLDFKLAEYHVIKLFQPFGKVVRSEYMWHKSGAKRGEPRGHCYIEYATEKEAKLAVAKMNGTLHLERPLVVRSVDEKIDHTNLLGGEERGETEDDKAEAQLEGTKSKDKLMTRPSKSKKAQIALIKEKLKRMREEDSSSKRKSSERYKPY